MTGRFSDPDDPVATPQAIEHSASDHFTANRSARRRFERRMTEDNRAAAAIDGKHHPGNAHPRTARRVWKSLPKGGSE